MNHFGPHIFKIFKLTLIVFAFPLIVFGQELQKGNTLEKEVKDILGKYAYLVGAIKPDLQPDPVRPFRELFRNVKVKIYNDLEQIPEQEMLSVRDYAEKIKTLYPDGLVCEIDYGGMKIGKIPENSDARKVIEVKVRRTVSFSNGQNKVRNTDKVVYHIGYDFEDGKYRNFLIHGITQVNKNDHDLIVAFSPSFAKVNNSNLASDPRFDIPWRTSWSIGANYQIMINKSWGLGTGLALSRRNHSLTLDKFDSFKGHNPNLNDIKWMGELTYLELPLYGVYHLPLGNKFLLEMRGGGYAAYRTFESITTEGRNTHSQVLQTGVISDPFNYENISEYDLGINLSAGLRYNIAKQWGLLIQAGFKQGLLSLEKGTDMNISTSIYEGQYNPLFHNSGSSSVSREIYLGLGVTIRLNSNKYFD